MVRDFTKFAYSDFYDLDASSLTESITREPDDHGYVLITIKDAGHDLAHEIRTFAQAVWDEFSNRGLLAVTAYRQLRYEEMGGAVPFDQIHCEEAVADIRSRAKTQSDRFHGLPVPDYVLGNPLADYIVFVEFTSVAEADAAAKTWKHASKGYAALTMGSTSGVNVFKNMKRYAEVSLNPDLIQFFNLFPGPGTAAALWNGWEATLPPYFDRAEFRSSFPLLATEDDQPLLLVNRAHVDSAKHFLLGFAFDPRFMEDIEENYLKPGFPPPHPFFCKVIPL